MGKVPVKKNLLVQAIKIYSDIPASFAALYDLGGVYIYNVIDIQNDCDVPITLKIGTSELIIDPGKRRLPDYRHNGVIQYKYTSLAPVLGTFEAVSW